MRQHVSAAVEGYDQVVIPSSECWITVWNTDNSWSLPITQSQTRRVSKSTVVTTFLHSFCNASRGFNARYVVIIFIVITEDDYFIVHHGAHDKDLAHKGEGRVSNRTDTSCIFHWGHWISHTTLNVLVLFCLFMVFTTVQTSCSRNLNDVICIRLVFVAFWWSVYFPGQTEHFLFFYFKILVRDLRNRKQSSNSKELQTVLLCNIFNNSRLKDA